MYKTNAIILAGGQSLRFGSNKAEMMIEGKRVIETLIDMLSGVCRQIIVVSNAKDSLLRIYGDKYPDVKVVSDIICGIGPLGGIHAGLLASDTQHNLVLACDMPFINIGFIKHIISQIKPEDMALIPMIHNRAEPLCGIYTKDCIKIIEGLISTNTVESQGKKSGEFRILQLLNTVRVRYIEEEAVRQFDPQMHMFFNVNTLQDMKQAEKMYDKL
ncbi:molybdenum cofactor guanylyltransferase [bacterium]|nr:molybdenum cofactor guanylyltransferase [bacterium]MBU1753942.1 molybdenum cofactor guanylyltransferase [bacterium]